ncbi:MAG: carboxypeptidase-like regulatory domain-containing protein [Verrucomicrobia bacterium]|nr:carboxypeptidase-like regulatory domain-containing protein [Verrucomicrobiota bacterium]
MSARKKGTQWLFSFEPLPFERANVELLVTDAEDRPVPNALIQLFDQGEQAWSLKTGASGQAEACLYPLAEAYDLRVTSGGMGAWMYDLVLRPGERRKLTINLAEDVSISGRVLKMDNSPQNAIVVQALREPDAGRAGLPVRPDINAAQGTPNGFATFLWTRTMSFGWQTGGACRGLIRWDFSGWENKMALRTTKTQRLGFSTSNLIRRAAIGSGLNGEASIASTTQGAIRVSPRFFRKPDMCAGFTEESMTRFGFPPIRGYLRRSKEVSPGFWIEPGSPR